MGGTKGRGGNLGKKNRWGEEFRMSFFLDMKVKEVFFFFLTRFSFFFCISNCCVFVARRKNELRFV